MREKGQGAIYEKNGGWVARLKFTDELGRPREKTLGAPTEKEARAKLKAFRKDLADGTAGPRGTLRADARCTRADICSIKWRIATDGA